MKMISRKSTPKFYTPQEDLARVGLKPEEIDIVIITHLHFDHVDQGALYKNARIIIQKDELEYALNPHPSQGLFFDRKTFENLNFEVIEGDREIVPGVSVLRIKEIADVIYPLQEPGLGVTG